MAASLVAATPREPVALDDSREPLRVVIASLALGGAERIVLDWLSAEAATGRVCVLAVLHPRRIARRPPAGVALRQRGAESPQDFVRALAREWSCARAPLSTHLIGDDLLAILWAAGLATVPVVHNAAPGWRNDARFWRAPHVPQAVACAGAVAAELRAHGATVPIAVVRHRPSVGPAAFDPAARARRAGHRSGMLRDAGGGRDQAAEGLRARHRRAARTGVAPRLRPGDRRRRARCAGARRDGPGGRCRARGRRDRTPAPAGLRRPDRTLDGGRRHAAQREPL